MSGSPGSKGSLVKTRDVERHFLEPLKSKPKKRRFATIDIESKHDDTQDPGFTRPFLVGFYDPHAKTKQGEEAYQEFRNEPHLAARSWIGRHVAPGGCIDKLLTVVLTKRYAGYAFYAHNGGNFDWLFLLAWLERHQDEFGFEIVPIQTTIQVMRVWRKSEDPDKPSKERWEFLDSMKLLPMSLAKACASFGVEGKADHDLAIHEDDASWSVYLKQDCVALATVMRRMYDLVERLGGEVGITAPSTAMKLYLRRFLGKDDVPDRIPRWRHWSGCTSPNTCGGCAHAWIRRGYYGGRTEPFIMKGEDLHYFDINSSYVASMRHDMPIGDRYVEAGKLDWRRWEGGRGRYTGFCECTVYVPPDCPIPPLPHVDEKTNKLIFPVGRFHGVWSVEELALLSDWLVGGRIEHVVKTVWFRKKPMFRAMVDTLWAFRAPQCPECRPGMQARGEKTHCPHYDEGLSALAKLLGNSTYGKFAMKHERTQIVFERDDRAEGRCDLCGEVSTLNLCSSCEGSKPASADPDDRLWYQAKTTDAPYIIPQIAAHITALSRVSLWRYMREAVSTRGPRTVRAGDLEPGDVGLLVKDAPAVVEKAAPRPRGRVELVVRFESEGELTRAMIVADADAPVAMGGRIFYTDTDSIVTDVMIKTGLLLGEMKDEYPGKRIDFECLQPKLYMLSVSDPSKPGEVKRKATMKGFDPVLKTPETFERVARGEVIDTVPDRWNPGTTKPWERLEKVRTLARKGFREPPRMRSVKKSMRSRYDKRVLLPDGIRTRPIVLDEPLGGIWIDDAAE